MTQTIYVVERTDYEKRPRSEFTSGTRIDSAWTSKEDAEARVKQLTIYPKGDYEKGRRARVSRVVFNADKVTSATSFVSGSFDAPTRYENDFVVKESFTEFGKDEFIFARPQAPEKEGARA